METMVVTIGVLTDIDVHTQRLPKRIVGPLAPVTLAAVVIAGTAAAALDHAGRGVRRWHSVHGGAADRHQCWRSRHGRRQTQLSDRRRGRLVGCRRCPWPRCSSSHHLDELHTKGRDINHRLLETERAGQGCAIGPSLFERIQQPYVREGQRTGALRFGDQRAMALAGALCATLLAVTGFTNRSLRALVAGLLGTSYRASQMTYDLRRLRLHGLIRRIEGRNRYLLTDQGLRFAVFYTKLGERVFPPLFATERPDTPPQLRRAMSLIDGSITSHLTDAGLAVA